MGCDASSPGVTPLTCVLGRLAPPRIPRDTYLVLREERKAFFRYRPGILGCRRERVKRESNAQDVPSYLRPGLVSVSDALVLGVLTLNCRITVIPEKQKRVNPRNQMQGYKFCCTINSGDGSRKDAKLEVSKSGTGQSCCRVERESWRTYVYGMSVEQNTRRRTGKNGTSLLWIGLLPMVHEPVPPG